LRDRSREGVQREILGTKGKSDSDFVFEKDEQRFAGQPFVNPDVPAEQTMPVAQFMTTYMVGDDLYDDSFSIDAPTGEFLGECGIGISETVGVGDPKRVTAFEVWLFDKNDIQTVTKVIMSAHAYDEDKIRMRLESKGEPVLAEPGKQVLLETATLQLEARVIDMEYGEGAAPDQSYFHRLTLELAVKAERVVESLFKAFIEEPTILPDAFQRMIDDKGLEQTICYYIAGMTDRYAIDEYQKLFDPAVLP